MLSAKEYADVLVDGEPWLYSHMEELAQWLQAAQAKNRRGKKEVEPYKCIKEFPWWDFIPIENFIVPLLHCLIGIDNGILTLLRNIISKKIEHLSLPKIETRGVLAAT